MSFIPIILGALGLYLLFSENKDNTIQPKDVENQQNAKQNDTENIENNDNTAITIPDVFDTENNSNNTNIDNNNSDFVDLENNKRKIKTKKNK